MVKKTSTSVVNFILKRSKNSCEDTINFNVPGLTSFFLTTVDIDKLFFNIR
jgi:hypothetical protein